MLFDEPCSALDPIATFKIEDMLVGLKNECTIIIVTHNMEQARRISDYTAFFYQGEIIEAGRTFDLFTHPQTELLNRYITGKFLNSQTPQSLYKFRHIRRIHIADVAQPECRHGR